MLDLLVGAERRGHVAHRALVGRVDEIPHIRTGENHFPKKVYPQDYPELRNSYGRSQPIE
jgi:hypothetical protein